MINPSYLSLSRHGIYYFRFPLPRAFRRKGKASHIKKVSLNTRCPQEGLRLARLLEYHAFLILQGKDIQSMEHGDILNLLRSYFYELVNQKKAAIHKDGQLSNKEVNSLLEMRDWAMQAIKDGTDEIIPGEDMKERLLPIASPVHCQPQ